MSTTNERAIKIALRIRSDILKNYPLNEFLCMMPKRYTTGRKRFYRMDNMFSCLTSIQEMLSFEETKRMMVQSVADLLLLVSKINFLSFLDIDHDNAWLHLPTICYRF